MSQLQPWLELYFCLFKLYAIGKVILTSDPNFFIRKIGIEATPMCITVREKKGGKYM